MNLSLHLDLRTTQLYNKVAIDTPILDFIHLGDETLAIYTFVDTPKVLAKAELEVIWPNNQSFDDPRFFTPKLLESISSTIKRLYLHCSTLEKLADQLDHKPFPELSKLNTFKVNDFLPMHYKNLMKFLQNCCPNLHMIVLRLASPKDSYSVALDLQPADCLLRKVKTIKMEKLTPDKDELELVKYLLRSARGLKALHLVVDGANASSVSIEVSEVQKAEHLRKEFEFCKELFTGSDGIVGCPISFDGKYFKVKGTQGKVGTFGFGNLGGKASKRREN